MGRLAFDDDGYSDIEMVLVEEVAKDVNVHCGACALGGISLLVGIKSVYVVTNTRYAMCHQQYFHPTIVTSLAVF